MPEELLNFCSASLSKPIGQSKPLDLSHGPIDRTLQSYTLKGRRAGTRNAIISPYVQSKNLVVTRKSYWICLHGAQVDLEAMGYNSDFISVIRNFWLS